MTIWRSKRGQKHGREVNLYIGLSHKTPFGVAEIFSPVSFFFRQVPMLYGKKYKICAEELPIFYAVFRRLLGKCDIPSLGLSFFFAEGRTKRSQVA